ARIDRGEPARVVGQAEIVEKRPVLEGGLGDPLAQGPERLGRPCDAGLVVWTKEKRTQKWTEQAIAEGEAPLPHATRQRGAERVALALDERVPGRNRIGHHSAPWILE